MWHLDELKPEILDEYVDLILPSLKKKVDAISTGSIKKYLSDEKLKKILCSTPKDLDNMIGELKDNLFQKNEFDKYISACKEEEKSQAQNEVIKKFKNENLEIIKVFNYGYLISSKPMISYKIASLIGVNACVYCNRQYILTVEKDDEKIVRPEFDHFFPKSIYPFFALSIYNLIPSCTICNQKCKHDTMLDFNLNPYEIEEGDLFRFSYNLKSIDELEVVVKPVNGEEAICDVAKKLLDIFHIQDIYDGHSKLELKDIYDFAYKYSPTYLENLLKMTNNKLHVTVEDAYRMLFGTEYKIKNYHNRPFSKFKKDLLKEFGVIKDDDEMI